MWYQISVIKFVLIKCIENSMEISEENDEHFPAPDYKSIDLILNILYHLRYS